MLWAPGDFPRFSAISREAAFNHNFHPQNTDTRDLKICYHEEFSQWLFSSFFWFFSSRQILIWWYAACYSCRIYEHKTCYWHDVCAVNDSVIEDEHHITGLFLVQSNRGSRSITLIGQYQGTTLVNKPVALGFSLWWQLFDISKQFCPLVRLGPYLFWSPESECWDIKAIRLLSPLYLRSSTQDPSLIIQ